MDMTYDSTVKNHKAVEWLMQNDSVFRVLMDTMKLSQFNAFAVVNENGDWIRERVAQVAEGMEVTEQEREEGYPLPKDEAERARRMGVRRSADLARSGDDRCRNCHWCALIEGHIWCHQKDCETDWDETCDQWRPSSSACGTEPHPDIA